MPRCGAHASLGPVDPRLDPADEAVAENDREHVPAPTAFGRWDEELPDVLELEQAPEQAAIPDDRVERGNERDGRRWARRRFQQLGLFTDDKALSADALHLDGNDVTAFDELFAQSVPSWIPGPPRVWLRGPETAEDISAAADTEQTVRAVPGQELVPELFFPREFAGEHVGREQSFEQVVVPAVPVAASEAEEIGRASCRERVCSVV